MTTEQWQKALTAEKVLTVKLQDICDERDRQVSALSTELRVAVSPQGKTTRVDTKLTALV